MSDKYFTHKIEQIHARIDEYYGQIIASSQRRSDPLIDQLVSDLSTSLEELHVAEEELYQQNEALLEMRTALEGQQRRYQSLFDSAPDGYLVTDSTGRIIEANRASAYLLGVPQDRLLRKFMVTFVSMGDRPAFRYSLQSLAKEMRKSEPGQEKHSNTDWEIQLKPKRGNPFLASIRLSIASDAQGGILRWTIRDVSERKRAEESMRESEMKFRSLAETTSVAILIIQDEDIRYANPAAGRTIGYSNDTLLGLKFLAIVHPEDRRVLERHGVGVPPGRLSEAVRIRRWEIRFISQQGGSCWADVTAGRILYEKKPAWVLTAYDITQRKEAEQDRKNLLARVVQVQEEERRRISRGLHDQMGQGLIALILGFKNLEAVLPEQERPTLLQLRKVAEELRQEMHSLALDLRPPSLDDLGLVTALANYAEEWSARNGIVVDFQANISQDRQIPAEISTAVYRIVQEALTNVLKHAGARRVSLILDRRGESILVIVEDDGQGFVIDQATKTPQPNRRLGLIGMKERAELIGGSLAIESTLGLGTSLFLRIPLEETRRPDANA
ncbi:MAG: PAS domain S-box protein [Chloroflexota bacterium]|nr:MAG: PAS domain S-box protein [Chloroflexota bacterium]